MLLIGGVYFQSYFDKFNICVAKLYHLRRISINMKEIVLRCLRCVCGSRQEMCVCIGTMMDVFYYNMIVVKQIGDWWTLFYYELGLCYRQWSFVFIEY